MNQLGRPRRRAAGQVIHFTKKNRVSTPRRIAGNAAAIDAAANDSEVEHLTHPANPPEAALPGASAPDTPRFALRDSAFGFD
jgi:hypothetical protein